MRICHSCESQDDGQYDCPLCAAKAEIERLRSKVEQLRSALERIEPIPLLLINRRPVACLDEILMEASMALAECRERGEENR